MLVAQLQEAVQKIASQVVKATRDSPGTSLSGPVSASASMFGAHGAVDGLVGKAVGRGEAEEMVLSAGAQWICVLCAAVDGECVDANAEVIDVVCTTQSCMVWSAAW